MLIFIVISVAAVAMGILILAVWIGNRYHKSLL